MSLFVCPVPGWIHGLLAIGDSFGVMLTDLVAAVSKDDFGDRF